MSQATHVNTDSTKQVVQSKIGAFWNLTKAIATTTALTATTLVGGYFGLGLMLGRGIADDRLNLVLQFPLGLATGVCGVCALFTVGMVVEAYRDWKAACRPRADAKTTAESSSPL